MADPTREPSPFAGSDPDASPGIPGWLKLLGIALVIVVLVVAAVMLVGGHTPPGGAH